MNKENNPMVRGKIHHLFMIQTLLCNRSRPAIVEMEREIRRRTPRLMIQTEIEALVESLFLEDVQDI